MFHLKNYAQLENNIHYVIEMKEQLLKTRFTKTMHTNGIPS